MAEDVLQARAAQVVRRIADLRPLPASVMLATVLVMLQACGTDTSESPTDPDGSEPQPATIRVEPDSFVIQSISDTVQLDAVVRDETGAVVSNAPIEWTSLSPDVLAVTAEGRVSAQIRGLAVGRVQAASGTLTAEAEGEVAITLCAPPVPPVRGAASTVPPEYVHQGFEDPDPFQLPYGISVGIGLDLAGDGDDDLVIVNSADDQDAGAVFVFRNDGVGTLSRDSLAIPAGDIHAPRAKETLDANGDGLTDILIADFGLDRDPFPGQRNLLLVQSGGALEDHGPTGLTTRPSLTHTITVGDVECDGDIDIFEGNIPSTTAPDDSQLWINQGDGFFDIDNSRLPENPGTFPYVPWVSTVSSEFCDVNNDGAPDLLVLGDSWSLLYNDGFGRFSEADPESIPTEESTDTYSADMGAFCLDADGDTHNDFLVGLTDVSGGGGEFRPSLRLWLNQGDGTFVDATTDKLNQSWPAGGGPGGIVVRDFNDDSWPDLLVIREPCAMFVNQGDGRFTQYEEEVFQNRPPQPGGCGAVPVDLDGDGILELIRVVGSDPMSVFRRR